MEMNIAHPFDWSKIDKKDYLEAMKESPFNSKPLYLLLKQALTDDINNQELFLEGLITHITMKKLNKLDSKTIWKLYQTSLWSCSL